MTNAEAIKIIDCYDIGFYDLSGEKIPADKLADAFDMAIEALEVLDNAPNTLQHVGSVGLRWIPCSERLPEEREVVLITNDKGNVRYGQFRGTRGKYWHWKGNTLEEVIAWMELPEPYREDGEE